MDEHQWIAVHGIGVRRRRRSSSSSGPGRRCRSLSRLRRRRNSRLMLAACCLMIDEWRFVIDYFTLIFDDCLSMVHAWW